MSDNQASGTGDAFAPKLTIVNGPPADADDERTAVAAMLGKAAALDAQRQVVTSAEARLAKAAEQYTEAKTSLEAEKSSLATLEQED